MAGYDDYQTEEEYIAASKRRVTMADTKELVVRLRITSNMVNMGEKISWGQDTALMDEAADALERLERERDEWRDAAHLSACEAHSGLLDEAEAEASTLRARVAKMEGVLARHREDREYVIGWNDGFDHALTKIVSLQFPTMLRKMWSGGEVQAWLDARIADARAALTESELTTLRTRVAKMEEALRAIDAKVVELGLAAQRKANGHKHEKFAAVRHSMRLIVSAALTEE